MKRFFRNPLKSATILLLVATSVVAAIQIFSGIDKENPLAQIRVAEQNIVRLKQQMHQSIEKIGISGSEEIKKYSSGNEFYKKDFTFYIIEKDSVMYWSDNEPAITDSVLLQVGSDEILNLPNGDFLAVSKNIGDRKIVGLLLIKTSYKYENKYLVNEFNNELGLSDGFSVSTSGDTLHVQNNSYYLLDYDEDYHFESGLIAWAYVIVFCIVLLAVYLIIRKVSHSIWKTLLFVLFIFALRTWMIYLKVPSGLYDHPVFSPTFYASSFYFNSLGDLLFNVILLLVLAISLYERIIPGKKHRMILYIMWAALVVGIHLLIRGVVINSRISLELSNPSDISFYSILAFTSISAILLCFLFYTAAVLRKLSGYTIIGRHAWLGITICGLYAAVTLANLNHEKEQEFRKVFAHKAEMSQDQVAEFLFRDREDRISSDTNVSRIIQSSKKTSEELSNYLNQKYFNGYLSRYNISAMSFDNSTHTDTNLNLAYYTSQAEQGIKTASKHLYFLKDGTGVSPYLAILPLHDNLHTLVISFSTRFLRTSQGFPELFMSGYDEGSPPDGYSLARYSGGSLVFDYGTYVYSLTGKQFELTNEEFVFMDSRNFNHLIHRINDNSFIVVTKAKESIVGVLTIFSWMFISLSFLCFIVFLLSGIIGEGQQWQWNLTRRVQASVIFLVVLTFVLVGAGTVFQINRKYLDEQRKSISNQVNALWFLVKEISVGLSFNSAGLVPNEDFDRLVANTNIDFNVYSPGGRMVYSSQPRMFEMGIVSGLMNPRAYRGLKERELTQYIHPENAGKLNYMAAYAPVTDQSGAVIAYLNLPYFEKQNELNKEVSVFLSALVNIYVLLFALAVIVTIFISSTITKPLLLIQEKMSGIRLGQINEKIAYKEKDEIGQLVHEYNRMIDDLSKSVEKLARSERESAWSEMARQVAHEIKNPLTPMKLSIQHLHRTFKDMGLGDNPLVERITSTLIQQIDTLSNIANAFSSFAKMPQPIPALIDLKELLQQMASLYSGEINIKVHEANESYKVMADRDQLIGIFSNLIKNAVQSIPPERRGTISIKMSREAGRITVEVADNGIGIPEDQRDKIFIPNFTTKSSGMGLGLAIARNIVEEAGGNIWFTSHYGQGSSFFVSLPEAR